MPPFGRHDRVWRVVPQDASLLRCNAEGRKKSSEHIVDSAQTCFEFGPKRQRVSLWQEAHDELRVHRGRSANNLVQPYQRYFLGREDCSVSMAGPVPRDCLATLDTYQIEGLSRRSVTQWLDLKSGASRSSFGEL